MAAQKLADGLFADEEGACRCAWCRATPAYRAYHDSEWGFPVKDDRRLFEKICLEGFQSGLSWLTILNKRDAFRNGFANFEIDEMAGFKDKDVERLVNDAGIVRHRGKIVSAINNAARAIELRDECGSLAAYFWRMEPDPATRPKRVTRKALLEMTTSPESVALSKDLKKRGWSFVGPTTVYAFMQAMGLVNDHIEGCATREKALQARAKFKVPA
jgi:DNA-3-methyladenine glycosylase I